MTDPQPIVVEADPEVGPAITEGFVGLYWLLLGGFALWALVAQRQLLLLVPVMALALWAWSRQVRSHAAEPIRVAIEVGTDEVVHIQGDQVQRVARRDARSVEVEDRWLGRTVGTWPVLEVRGSGRRTLLEVTLWDREATEAALRQKGWLDASA